MQLVNAWFVRPPRFGLRPLTENHLPPYGDIPPPLFNAQVQPSLSRIFMHSGRMLCALALVAKRQNDPRSAALPAVTNIHRLPLACEARRNYTARSHQSGDHFRGRQVKGARLIPGESRLL